MHGFKHMPKFGDELLTGASIQIGTLTEYRNSEGPRADPLEGIVAHTHSPFRNLPEQHPDFVRERQGLRSLGIEISGNVGHAVIEGNVEIVRTAAAYIFCVSDRPDNSLRHEGQRIFRIGSLHKFAQCITDFVPILEKPRIGYVSYRDRTANVMCEPKLVPDPFVKEPKFQFEREIRIVWTLPGRDEDYSPYLQISCPKAAKFVREI